jgi:hypothetical protein
VISALARQIRLFFTNNAPPVRPRYRPEQVQAFFRGNGSGADTVEIGRMVERLPTIWREPGVRRRYDGFQRYFDVLPRIIFLYHRGVPTGDISENLSFLATDVGIERVVQITAELVAERLNQLSP